ncbi:DUF1566 domain-containing protein [Flavobacterium undicola]|uniref:DUF1566 domain-containing protein n=1 Tax=Flavobacterium undicola TaxID=1932779 RepID=UPI001378932F|nr:DUF1566 domain-containing protein [Flavobacterium undicola]MBA0883085.1 DUF1566 domain-containing protein [Flavobacterium undicola]
MRNIKNYLLITIVLFIANGTFAQGISKYGQIISTTTSYLNKNGGIGFYDGLTLTGNVTISPLGPGIKYQGGTIVYLFQNGDTGYVPGETHGLIASNEDVGYTGWGCPGVATNAIGTVIGTGVTNTATILAICNAAGTPAKLCDDYAGGGYTDWYWPSKDELNKIYLTLSYFTNVNAYLYWSSSEVSSANAIRQHMAPGNGGQPQFGKNSNSHIRAMRTF